MSLEAIRDIIAGALRDMNLNPPSLLTPELGFNKDLGVDSLGRAELIARLERAFRIEVSDGDYQHLTTVGETENYIQRRLSAADA
jgi:acyl carrier protein